MNVLNEVTEHDGGCAVRSVQILNLVRHGLGRRLFAGVTFGVLAWLVIQVVRLVAEASGICTGCAAADDPDTLAAVTLGGLGGSLGGGGDENNPPQSPFDRWMDNVLGGRPERSVEGVDPPSAPSPPPADPEAQRAAEEEARRLWDLYKRAIGTKGVVDMPQGSLGDTLNDAMDAVLDFGSTPIGPSSGGDGGDSGSGDRP